MPDNSNENPVIESQHLSFAPDDMLDAIKGMWAKLRDLESEEAVKEWFLAQSEEELARLYSVAAALHVITAMMEHGLQKAYGLKTGHGIQMDGLAGPGGDVVMHPHARQAQPQRRGKDVFSALFGGNGTPKQVA